MKTVKTFNPPQKIKHLINSIKGLNKDVFVSKWL